MSLSIATYYSTAILYPKSILASGRISRLNVYTNGITSKCI